LTMKPGGGSRFVDSMETQDLLVKAGRAALDHCPPPAPDRP
jgi:hypothetical protein